MTVLTFLAAWFVASVVLVAILSAIADDADGLELFDDWDRQAERGGW